jgi:hypothetical protein
MLCKCQLVNFMNLTRCSNGYCNNNRCSDLCFGNYLFSSAKIMGNKGEYQKCERGLCQRTLLKKEIEQLQTDNDRLKDLVNEHGWIADLPYEEKNV